MRDGDGKRSFLWYILHSILTGEDEQTHVCISALGPGVLDPALGTKYMTRDPHVITRTHVRTYVHIYIYVHVYTYVRTYVRTRTLTYLNFLNCVAHSL